LVSPSRARSGPAPSTTAGRRIVRLVVVATLVAGALATVGQASALAAPAGGFEDRAVVGGLTQPTAVEFTPGGTVFVAEKRGVVKVLRNLRDPKPTVFADLRREVYSNWDRGLLGLALPPDFEANPWVYVMYTYNARIGGKAPLWPSSGSADVDDCPTPPGFQTAGCVVSGRHHRRRRPARRRLPAQRRRARPGRGLVPAVPEPLDRRPRLRA